jgi:hypothetical protein
VSAGPTSLSPPACACSHPYTTLARASASCPPPPLLCDNNAPAPNVSFFLYFFLFFLFSCLQAQHLTRPCLCRHSWTFARAPIPPSGHLALPSHPPQCKCDAPGATPSTTCELFFFFFPFFLFSYLQAQHLTRPLHPPTRAPTPPLLDTRVSPPPFWPSHTMRHTPLQLRRPRTDSE